MKSAALYKALVLSLIALPSTGQMVMAQDIFDSYIAVIGTEDLYSSKGARLQTAGAVLQQDRANVHKFGIRQAGDTGDTYFTTAAERAKMSEAVNQSNLPKSLTDAIVNGTVGPLRIDIYGYDESGVDYLEISPAY